MVFSFSRTLNLAQRDVPDTIKTCFNTSVENKREARGKREVCCMHMPSQSSVVRNGVERNIFMLMQHNEKGSNLHFMQTNSGLHLASLEQGALRLFPSAKTLYAGLCL